MAFKAVSPLSHPVNVSVLPASGRHEKLRPGAETLKELGEDHGLLAVEAFEADLVIRKWQRDGVRVTGTLRARIVQACVVTLEPVPSTIETGIDAVFLPEGSRLIRKSGAGEAAELVIDPEGEDAPETFVPPDLDVGAVAEEFFELAIDPFPRAPDAPQSPVETSPAPERENPFAVLAKLKGAKPGE